MTDKKQASPVAENLIDAQTIKQYFTDQVDSMIELSRVIDRPDITQILEQLQVDYDFEKAENQTTGLMEEITSGPSSRRERIAWALMAGITILKEVYPSETDELSTLSDERKAALDLGLKRVPLLRAYLSAMLSEGERNGADIWQTAAVFSNRFYYGYTHMVSQGLTDDPQSWDILDLIQLEAYLAHERVREKLMADSLRPKTMQA